jgi:hypothetical protein
MDAGGPSFRTHPTGYEKVAIVVATDTAFGLTYLTP